MVLNYFVCDGKLVFIKDAETICSNCTMRVLNWLLEGSACDAFCTTANASFGLHNTIDFKHPPYYRTAPGRDGTNPTLSGVCHYRRFAKPPALCHVRAGLCMMRI